LVVGAVFALAFSPDGESAVCAAANGVFRRDRGGWLRAKAPDSAIPARALGSGPANDRFFLLSRSRRFSREDGGRTFAIVPGLSQTSEMTALATIAGSDDTLAAVIDGRATISRDRGRTWRNADFGGADAPVDTIATDATRSQRIWAAAG